MNARNNVKNSPFQRLGARFVPAMGRLRLGARLDALVAGWLQRSAASAEAAQHWFNSDRSTTGGSGIGVSLVSSPRWNESAST
jgi:hypothetical protein